MEILRERLLCAKVLKDLGFLDSSTYEGFKSAVDLAQSNKYDNVSVDQLIRSMGEKLKASVTPAELPAMQERIKHLEFMNTSEGLDSAKQAEILYLQEQLGQLKREKDDANLQAALARGDATQVEQMLNLRIGSLNQQLRDLEAKKDEDEKAYEALVKHLDAKVIELTQEIEKLKVDKGADTTEIARLNAELSAANRQKEQLERQNLEKIQEHKVELERIYKEADKLRNIINDAKGDTTEVDKFINVIKGVKTSAPAPAASAAPPPGAPPPPPPPMDDASMAALKARVQQEQEEEKKKQEEEERKREEKRKAEEAKRNTPEFKFDDIVRSHDKTTVNSKLTDEERVKQIKKTISELLKLANNIDETIAQSYKVIKTGKNEPTTQTTIDSSKIVYNGILLKLRELLDARNRIKVSVDPGELSIISSTQTILSKSMIDREKQWDEEADRLIKDELNRVRWETDAKKAREDAEKKLAEEKKRKEVLSKQQAEEFKRKSEENQKRIQQLLKDTNMILLKGINYPLQKEKIPFIVKSILPDSKNNLNDPAEYRNLFDDLEFILLRSRQPITDIEPNLGVASDLNQQITLFVKAGVNGNLVNLGEQILNRFKGVSGGTYEYDHGYNSISGGALPDNYIYLILVIIVLILILLFMSSRPSQHSYYRNQRVMTCSA
jgi:hypothetical protein